MKRATYKCLDDLIQEGLDPSIVKDLDKAEKLIRMVHGKDNMKEVSVKELTSLNEPWHSNP